MMTSKTNVSYASVVDGFEKLSVADRRRVVADVLDGYAYKSEADKKKAQEFMIGTLKGFVVDIASSFYGLAEREDLYQAGFLAICSAIGSYDPKVAMPTTYFRPYILGNMQKLCFGGQSQYYNTMKKKITDACARFNAALDPNDPNIIQDFELVPDEKLANITGLPISTIKEAKRQNRQTSSSLTAIGDTIACEYNSSPEGMFIHDEKINELAEAIRELPEVERFIIEKSFLGDKEVSVKAVARELNKYKDTFGIRCAVDATYVEKKKENALKKMRAFFRKHDNDVPIMGDYLSSVSEDDIEFASKEKEETELSLEDILDGEDLIKLF